MSGINTRNQDSLTMSTRKRALFTDDANAVNKEHNIIEQLIQEDYDELDLGVSCLNYDSCSTTSSEEYRKDQSVPQTPNSWRMTTRSRSSKKREKNLSTPLSFEVHSRRTRRSDLTYTPCSSRSLNIDTESCSNSLQDLTFDTDSENDASAENSPVKPSTLNLRSSERLTTKKLYEKFASKTNSRASTPHATGLKSFALEKSDLRGMKTPQESIHLEVPPSRHHVHNRRSQLESRMKMDCASPSRVSVSTKRTCDDMLEVTSPQRKSLRAEPTPTPKARHSLFSSDTFKHFISPKSFYAKANESHESQTSFTKSNSTSPVIISKPLQPFIKHVRTHRAYKKKTGEINKGVRHGIRKPKQKRTKMDVLKMALDIIENSPLNEYLNKIMKKNETDPSKNDRESASALAKNPSELSENQLKKMDGMLRQLGCETSIYKLFQNKTFADVNRTNAISCDESMDDVEEVTEEIALPKDTANNKFFKSRDTSKSLTVKLSHNIKAQVQNGKIILPKRHLKQTNKDIFKNTMAFDDEDDDICDTEDKENISNLINQWDEEEIPNTEPQVNKDFVDVMQNIKENELLVSGSKSTDQNVAMNEDENGFVQLVSGDNGGYLVIDDMDVSDDDVQYDIEKIEAELKDLDRTIKMVAEMNNINPEALLSSPTAAAKGIETGDENCDEIEQKRLFPVFLKGHQSTSVEENDKKTSGTKTSRKYNGRPDDKQYIIDAGQKKLRPIKCSECGVFYNIGDPEDERYHEMHHFSLNVLKFQGWKKEAVRGQWEDGSRCIVVGPGDPAYHWNRISQLLDEIVNPQLGFATSLDRQKQNKVYLYIQNKMIMGCLVSEPRTWAYKMLNNEGIDCCSTETYPVKCGVSRIWTHSEHRRKGVADRMMRVMLRDFSGCVMAVQEIAFSSPTPAGKAFIEKFTKTKEFFVYLQ